MDTATIAQGLRASAALIDLASRTATAIVVDTLEHLADRVHPSGLEGYAEFDTDVRLCNLDGYLRVAQAEAGIDAALADAAAASRDWEATRAKYGPGGERA